MSRFLAARLGLPAGAGSVKRTERFTKSTEHWRTMARRTFALDTESEAGDFDPPEDPAAAARPGRGRPRTDIMHTGTVAQFRGDS